MYLCSQHIFFLSLPPSALAFLTIASFFVRNKLIVIELHSILYFVTFSGCSPFPGLSPLPPSLSLPSLINVSSPSLPPSSQFVVFYILHLLIIILPIIGLHIVSICYCGGGRMGGQDSTESDYILLGQRPPQVVVMHVEFIIELGTMLLTEYSRSRESG